MKTTNDKSREVSSLGKVDPSPTGSSSHQAPVACEEAEAHDDDDTMGDEAEAVTFPQKLMEALDRETSRDDATISASGERVFEWLPAGNAFLIRDRARFKEEVLPKYFTKCKFMSFTRKLYRWGFRQVSKDSQLLKVFQHVHFVRGEKQRCLKMRSIVKLHRIHPQPRGNFVTGYDAVHQDQPLVSFSSASGYSERMATGPMLPTSYRPFPPQATAARLQSEGINILKPPVFDRLEGRFSSSLLKERPRLEEEGQSRGQLLDMPNDRSQQATTPHLQNGGNGLPSSCGVLGLGLQGSIGMASAEIMERRLRLQEIEQKRQQLVDMLNNSRPQAPLPRLQREGLGVPNPPALHSVRVPIGQLLQRTTAAASVENVEGRRLLREMEQHRRQLTDALGHRSALWTEQRGRHLQDMLENGSASRASAPLFGRPPVPQQPPSAVMAPDHNYGTSQRERDASHAVVRLASEILKRGPPGMEPRRALELARRVRVNHR